MKSKFRSFVLVLAVVSFSITGSAFARNLRLAHVVNEQDSFHVAALKIKEVVESESKGDLGITIFPNAKLGDERTLLENIRMGVVDMAIITGGPIINFMPEFGVFDLPFLFRDEEHAYKVLDGKIGQDMLAAMDKAGWVGLAYGERGFRDLTNSAHPVATPDDMKGLKIRLMENPVYVEAFRALGANAVPMAWTETLTALQQHTIDGQENPLNVIVSFKLYDSQKYLTQTHHTYSPNVIMMSKRCWNSLNAEQQALVKKAAQMGAQANRDIDNKNAAEWLQFLKEQGMVVTEPDGDAFRAAVAPIYEQFGAKYGTLVKEIQEIK